MNPQKALQLIIMQLIYQGLMSLMDALTQKQNEIQLLIK